MIRWFDAVVDGYAVYARHVGTGKSIPLLPDCVHPNGSLAIVCGRLTSIGGNSDPGSYVLNELFSLTGEGSGRKWTKKLPSMPTKRRQSIALCTGPLLIVAGGEGEDYNVVSTVGVMDTETHQWSTAADLATRNDLPWICNHNYVEVNSIIP